MIRVLTGAAIWLAILCGTACAQTAPDPVAQRVLEGIKLSLKRLDTIVGEARFSYAQPGVKAATHRAAFSFKKPFQVLIREHDDGFQFSHRDGRVRLYFPREADVLEFNLEDADAGVVRRMLGLLEVQNFAAGFGLGEVSAHFTVKASERSRTFEAEIVPYPNGVWRRVLGLHRILVTVSRWSYLPLRIRVYQRSRPPAPPSLAFDMELTGLEINGPVDDERFEIALPARVNHLGTSELVQFLLGSSMKDGKEMLQSVTDEMTDRLKKFSTSPWDF